MNFTIPAFSLLLLGLLPVTDHGSAPTEAVRLAQVPTLAQPLPPDAQREHDELMARVRTARSVSSPLERKRLLRLFMNQGTPFIARWPSLRDLWLARTEVACEVNQGIRAWTGAMRLRALGVKPDSNPSAKAIFALINSNGWTQPNPPAADLNESEEEIRRLAGDGDSWFQMIMGMISDSALPFRNRTAPTDDREAVKWYLRAADAGEPFAQSQIGYHYALGLGLPKDEVRAVEWYKRAADSGYPPAMCDLAMLYSGAPSLTPDPVRALTLYEEAARSGYPRAMRQLGIFYMEGLGAPKDETAGLSWLRRAAEADDADGMFNLGLCFATGTAVTKNLAEAVKWYHQAADRGVIGAMTLLGDVYENGGEGVPKDEDEAVKWYHKAAAAGSAQAKAALERLRH